MPAQDPQAVPSQAAADYTQSLRDLTDEIGRGMRAIAENRIVDLRGSLVRQQTHCALLRTTSETAENLQEFGPMLEPELARTMEAARKDLIQMTRAYKGLIERSRRSASLLEGLCGSHAGQYLTGSRPLHGRLHLSCEA